MLIEGVKLLIMGMTMVFLFLVVMMYCIQLVTWMSRHVTEREQKQMELESLSNAELPHSSEESRIPIAVFAAAIAAYEAER
ncbi:MAG: OadG family protein [SAR324 cluster bacterium]|nr:OadG family protein [SAR324 cluster bacterium]